MEKDVMTDKRESAHIDDQPWMVIFVRGLWMYYIYIYMYM